MKGQRSIVRQLIISVLLVESFAAVALVGAIALHEYRLQLSSFQAALRGRADSLLGAVQDAEDAADNVMLDSGGLHLGKGAIYRVEDETGRVLGGAGSVPDLRSTGKDSDFVNVRSDQKNYRFIVLHGIRTIDPGRSDGGVSHRITVLYGEPLGHVWHEVFEAIRFFAFATALLLAMTSVVLIVALRYVLRPLHDLTTEASQISALSWNFNKPETVSRTVELAPLADALSDAIARLKLSFAQQRRFTSDAAHELKTDVAIVKSSLQLLSMKTRSEQEYRHGVTKTILDISRLEKTLQAMLTLARLEQPAVSSQTYCQLGEVVEETVLQCEPYAEMRKVRLISETLTDSQVRIDRSDAFLLCSNLVMNAIQHSEEGQIVEVRLNSPSDGKLRLTVKDFGEGIDKEDVPFVFDAFYRSDLSRSRKSGGTGLGLAICKAICDRVGGAIAISSEIGRGTTVTAELVVSQI